MRKKLAVIMVMLVLVAASLATTVSASSFTATMTPNRTTVDESNEVVVTIKVSNLDVGTTESMLLKVFYHIALKYLKRLMQIV